MLQVVRALSLFGAGLSLYLLVMSLAGHVDGIAGCGGAHGCSEVLGSRWSQVLGIPVSAFSLATYCLILALSFRKSQNHLLALALILLMAVAWFTGLQLFVTKAFCPWCMAIHFVGLATALTIFAQNKSLNEDRSISAALVWSLVPFGLMILAQVIGPSPDSHLISETQFTFAAEDTSIQVHARGKGKKVKFDGKEYCLDSLPHIGPSDAPYVLIEYYDYCCKACKRIESDLTALQHKHPGKFAVILLPVPMNRRCNDHLPEKVVDHGYACEYARFALAAWRANPDRYPKVHQRLFQRPIIHPSVMKKEIESIMKPVELEPYLSDPWIDELLAGNSNDFQDLIAETIKMPKLRLKSGRFLSGVVNETEEFILLIESNFGLEQAAQ